MWERYREGLKRLKGSVRRLIVGRAELGYNCPAPRRHRRPADSARGAHGAQARPDSAQRVHAASRPAVASRRPTVDLAEGPPPCGNRRVRAMQAS